MHTVQTQFKLLKKEQFGQSTLFGVSHYIKCFVK